MVGEVGPTGCGHSRADLNERSETAVWGSGESVVSALRHTETTELLGSAGEVEKGLGTSLATLMMVSNLVASSRLGSR